MLAQRLFRITQRIVSPFLEPVARQEEQTRVLLGNLRASSLPKVPVDSLAEVEFQVFSQWGEDGIIQYLIRNVPIENRSFIEFGVEDYSEANTRFLLVNNNWRGLILDGGERHIAFCARRGLRWRHTLEAVSAFVTRENVNGLFERAGFTGDIGLLSIDVDGNDYWIWKSIEIVQPRIVIVEYNAGFGPDLPLVVPYRSDFSRLRAHHSGQYYGASLAAFAQLGEEKGYRFIGCNSAGNNAFFIRKDLETAVTSVGVAEGFVGPHFRDSRDSDGALTYATTRNERLAAIADLPLVDLRNGEQANIRSLLL